MKFINLLKEKFSDLKQKIAVLLFADDIFYVGGPQTLPPPLKKKEEEECMARLADGDESVRQTLIVHNLRLVVYIAKKFENSGVGVEDLVSIGTIGLIKAVNTFRPDKNIKLATYASRCVENEILMYLRKTSSLKNEISFDEPLNTDWDGNELLLSDILTLDGECVNRNIEYEDEKRTLMRVLECLDERERLIIDMRFGMRGNKEHTQKEVADIMGISQSYISRLEKRIISTLKKEMVKFE